MAFIVAAGVRFAVKGVQSGIQAHKDHKSDETIQPPLDRYGRPKGRHIVYGLVTKAETRFNSANKGRGRDVNGDGGSEGSRSEGVVGEERRLNKEEYESENYGPQTYDTKGTIVSDLPFS